MHRTRSSALALTLAMATVAMLLASPSIAQQPDMVEDCGTVWTEYTRPPTHAGQRVIRDVHIPMPDGVELVADVFLPADGPAGPFPTLLTITGYNKNAGAFAPNPVLLPRGYAHVIVDDRGTGNSGGQWDVWSAATQEDYDAVLDWVDAQEWSDGIGLTGPSWMGITSLFAAARQHPAVKAAVPIVPAGDLYRDIVLAGGIPNVEFIPPWLGIVIGTGLAPGWSPADYPTTLTDHLVGHVELSRDVLLPVITGDEDGPAFDGPFWRERSPIELVDRIDVPTLLVGGLDDLFQRGTPLLFEGLRRRGVETRLVMGPWAHLTQFVGVGGPDTSGVPDRNGLTLRWFDEFLMGLPEANAECIPPVTQWQWGPERWAVQPDWPHPDATAVPWYLGGDGTLTTGASSGPDASVDDADRTVPPLPANGVCSRETSQWSMGLVGIVTPCANGSALTDAFELVYETEPFTEDVVVNGPIEADLWVSSTTADASITVRVADVAPGGSFDSVTAGWMLASHAAVDDERSRLLNGMSIQPWHPFTAEGQQLLGDEPVLVPVEIFPTSWVIEAGHRLKISIGPTDFPHNLPTMSQGQNLLGGVTTIHHGAEHPSRIVLPVVAADDGGVLPSQIDDSTTSRDDPLPATGPLAPFATLGVALVSLAAVRRRR